MRLPDPRTSVYARLFSATFFLGFVVIFGATAYWQVGEGRWSFFDCLYMTVITLSTVGFGETLPGMGQIEEARIITLALIILGSGTLLYFMSNLTALIVEGDLGGIILARRMQRRIGSLENHVIVCGIGNTGVHIVEELVAVHEPFVVIEQDAHRVERLREDLGTDILHVIGDATDDHSLNDAGIERCKGVIAALHEDKDNLFVVISARALNKDARIVAKAVEHSAEAKLVRAGANTVVSPNFIGGMRLVSEMIRPAAVEFLDRMLRDRDLNLRIEEAEVPEGSALVGQTLANSGVRATGALVLAVRDKDGVYVYKPPSDYILTGGAHLIVIAQTPDLARLRDGLKAGKLV